MKQSLQFCKLQRLLPCGRNDKCLAGLDIMSENPPFQDYEDDIYPGETSKHREKIDDLAEHCKGILTQAKNKEEVLTYLKEIGCSLTFSFLIWGKANDLSLDEARIQVLGSKTWENERSDAIDFHNQALDIMDTL